MADKKRIDTEIIINASPEKVWSVFSDFDNCQWNPLIDFVKGELVVGRKIKVSLSGIAFTSTVLRYKPNYELTWHGHLLFKGLFHGEHGFILVDNGDGTTTFKQFEKFNGIAVGLMRKKIDNTFLPSYIEMNESLKKRVEGLKG